MLPREKLSQWGVSSLTIADLIAVILSSGTKNKDVFKISKEVEKIFKRQQFEFSEFSNVKGVGKVKAMKLVCAVELGIRLNIKENNLKKIISSKEAYETLRYIGKYTQEHFVAVFLNARYELLGKKTLGIGTVNSVQILPRDIILTGLSFNATFVIIAHNHPSNDSTPSKEDIEVGNRIQKALEIVGMELIDNLIITKDGWNNITK